MPIESTTFKVWTIEAKASNGSVEVN